LTRFPKSFFAIILCAILLSGCSFRATNYRLTIEVEGNGAVYSGTGVWRYETIRGWSETFKGQAIPIDVGTKGTIYVLLRQRTPEGNAGDNMYYIGNLFTRSGVERRIGASLPIDCPSSLRGGGSYCPFMVRFRDDRDPATVEAVDPNDMTVTFGPGVSLRSITVTITKDCVTEGLVKRLPWVTFKGKTSAYLVEPPFGMPRSNWQLHSKLIKSDFSEGTSR
jgi:hypothetical protein